MKIFFENHFPEQINHKQGVSQCLFGGDELEKS